MKVKLSVEMTIEERGLVREDKAYLRDSEIELEDLLDWTKYNLIVISDQVLWEEQAMGFDEKPLMLVDGKSNKSFTEVSPLGSIEFISRQSAGHIVLEAYESLLELSKVRTGRYISSHIVTHNGDQVASNLLELKVWLKLAKFEDKDVIRIVNDQPYARRLELLGVTSKRQQARRDDPGRRRGRKTGTIIKVPNGAYQLTYRRIRAKYKNNVRIRFMFMAGTTLGIKQTKPGEKGPRTTFAKGRPGKNSVGRAYLYPTLVFDIDERGILP